MTKTKRAALWISAALLAFAGWGLTLLPDLASVDMVLGVMA